jgi:hypothetical protein
MSLTKVQTDGPTGIVQYRCVYCNCEFATTHAGEDCTCKVTVCPNSECPSHRDEVGA